VIEMQALEELRKKIKTVEDMQSVVSTMKTLAAARIRQFEAAADATRSYDETVQLGLQVLLRDQAPVLHADSSVGSGKCRTGLILLGTDQGFCGRFNQTVLESAVAYLNDSRDKRVDSKPMILCAGGRLSRMLESKELPIEQSLSIPGSVSKILAVVQKMLIAIEGWRRESAISRIVLIYNRRRTASAYEIRRIQLLPIPNDFLELVANRDWQSRSIPVCAVPRKQLLSSVIQQHIFIQLYRACAESLASENASRIAAMQKAESNIEGRLEGLSTRFNQSRQRAITEELLDIISGFETT